MTDEELSAKVAEIEGWKWDKDWRAWVSSQKPVPSFWMQDAPPPYATDWTWCGPLLKRDIIRLEWDTSKPSRQWMALAKHGVLVIYNETPQIAICRAVIAAHEQAILANHEPPTPGPDRSPGRPHLAD